MGDSSDNIPGVHGIGEKTAKKLIKQYGSIKGIIENKEEIKGKMGERIRENVDIALMTYDLATIVFNVPIDLVLEDYEFESMDAEKVQEVFTNLYFRI